jgi:hypothetical protein
VSARLAGLGYGTCLLLVLGAVATIGAANAVSSPLALGYDTAAHRTYADLLIHKGHIPRPDESQEFNSPPGFYAVAGVAEEIASGLGASQPWQVARALNVLFVLGAMILTLLIARELFSGQPRLQIAALSFAGFVPVVLKVGAMFHPEPLSLFASTLTLYLIVRMLAHRSFGLAPATLLGLSLGGALLIRGFNLWLVPVVVAGVTAGVLTGTLLRRQAVRTTVVALAAAALLAGPWYARQAIEYSNPLAFNRSAPDVPVWDRRSMSFYTGLGLPEVLTHPTRPHFVNELAPTLYSDIWGDYFGYFVWATNNGAEAPVALDDTRKHELIAQNLFGAVPTLLALGGLVAILRRSLGHSGRRAEPALLVVALLPVAGLLGFLAFTISYPSGDGDVIKASYLLTTVPGWAIGFGYAFDRVARFRLGRVFIFVACGLALASDPVFLLHRGPLGPF